jgi:hypothetical protein
MTQPKPQVPQPPLEDQVLARMLAAPPQPKIAAKKQAKKPPKK